ncbi:MAG: TonB-dependent receptor [Acidobacteria bacterium]|nr:TonB-dependent receptor [Acidobacteriota bacterium]
MSGPIGGKTTSFLLSVNREETDSQGIVNAFTLAGPVRANVPTPQRNLEISGTITHAVGKKQTLTLRATYQHETVTNEGVGGTTLPEGASNSSDREEQLIFSHQVVFNQKLVNQVRLLVGHDRAPTVSLTQAPGINVNDAFSGGGAQSDSVDTETHFTLNDTLAWSSPRHLIKAGFAIPDWSRRASDDHSNMGGTFSFASLDDYAAGRPYRFVQQRGDGRLLFTYKVLAMFVQDEIAVRPNVSVSVGMRYDWLSFYGDRNNLGPRVSFAYAPGSRAGTVIRGGAGLFYDRTGEGPIADVLHSSQGRLFRYILVDPGYPNPLIAGTSLADQPPSLVQLSPTLNIP